jgi:hypothetical protein
VNLTDELRQHASHQGDEENEQRRRDWPAPKTERNLVDAGRSVDGQWLILHEPQLVSNARGGDLEPPDRPEDADKPGRR